MCVSRTCQEKRPKLKSLYKKKEKIVGGIRLEKRDIKTKEGLKKNAETKDLKLRRKKKKYKTTHKINRKTNTNPKKINPKTPTKKLFKNERSPPTTKKSSFKQPKDGC